MQCDVPEYWQQKTEMRSKLSCVLAASMSSGRVFSVVERTVEDRRCQLKGDTVDAVDGLLFLRRLKQ